MGLKRTRTIARTIIRGAWLLARVAVVVGAIGITVAWRQYGYVPVAVQSGSMEPTVPIRSLVFVHEVPVDDIRKGDVITFDPPGAVPRTTHRVVERTQHAGRWYFRTRGDANPVDDDWRPPNDTPQPKRVPAYLRGVAYDGPNAVRMVAHVPYLGYLAELSARPNLRKLLLLVPFAFIALQLLSWIWGPRGRRTDAAAAQGDGAAPADMSSAPRKGAAA